ncbi:MAG: hypothetical protein JNL98_23990 [Bryobacterales bacterium]|nr:hypothetical protein [Bryobacterales bacterium]
MGKPQVTSGISESDVLQFFPNQLKRTKRAPGIHRSVSQANRVLNESAACSRNLPEIVRSLLRDDHLGFKGHLLCIVVANMMEQTA